MRWRARKRIRRTTGPDSRLAPDGRGGELDPGLARRAPPRRRQARPGARDHPGRESRRRGGPAGRRALPAHRKGPDRRHHGAAGRRQEHADRRPDRGAAKGRSRRGGALDRPLEPVHAGRDARGQDPAGRPLSGPRGVHPLDGDARLTRRPRGGGAPGGPADGRLGQGRRAARDRGGRPGRGRRGRPRRHDRARPDAGLRRLDPGAEGGRDGDPRRDRRQQVGSSARRHHGPRGAGGAVAWPTGHLEGARRANRSHEGTGDRRVAGADRRPSPAHRGHRLAGRAPGAEPARRGARDRRRPASSPAWRSELGAIRNGRGCSTASFGVRPTPPRRRGSC